MTGDYPRLTRFWRWLFAVIGVLWTLYGLAVMVLELATDPEAWLIFLAMMALSALFCGALIWGPTHRLALRHPTLLYAAGVLTFGSGLLILFTQPSSSPLLPAGMVLMVGGVLVVIIPWLLRHERNGA